MLLIFGFYFFQYSLNRQLFIFTNSNKGFRLTKPNHASLLVCLLPEDTLLALVPPIKSILSI